MLRLGVVDFDSSHCVEFTRRINHVGVDREQFVEGARVEGAWRGDSQMAPERIPGFEAEMRGIGVEFVDRMEDLFDRVDAVLILSLCGAAHLPRARPFLEAGIPTFVDKPFTCSVSDAREIIRLANENDTLILNASGLRFSEQALRIRQNEHQFGRTVGAVTYGPSKRADGNPGLFHYGIHSVELLFELLGTGCESVTAVASDGGEVVTGRWSDGRIGTVRGNREGATPYGFVAFCENTVVSENVSTRFAYRNLCQAIVASVKSGVPAVRHESSLQVVQFIEAALQSEQQDGASILLAEVGQS